MFSALFFLTGMLAAMIASCTLASRGMQRAQEILQRGQSVQGRILRVWRPPIAGSFARIYFEFVPQGMGEAVRCCHVDRRVPGSLIVSLPPAGATVRVSYLPENPREAVIARLVARFVP